jgi:hypothetical protein
MGHRSSDSGDPDDQQRTGRRRVRRLVQQVHEGGNGQDRAAAAEGAERNPDQQPDRDGDQQHADRRSFQVKSRASSERLRRGVQLT